MATDLVSDGEYLYAVNNGYLMIYDITSSESPCLISSMSGIGNARKIAIDTENRILAISSRENGTFIVDISKVLEPSIISNIYSMGLATGICISGDYCFVCVRRHGVEIYNISNPEQPTYCGRAFDGGDEAYDCCVDNGYLYVSCWAEQKIKIYSLLEDIGVPSKISEFKLNGCGAGLVARDGILYVSTGYSCPNARRNITDPGYGMGNGLDIFDVSNPHNVSWLSTSKIDGRYVYGGFDHWKVYLSGDYAYLLNAFNGVFVFDVEKPNAPKRLDNYVVNIPVSSKYYKEESTTSRLFTFDVKDHAQGIVSSIAFSNGRMYIATLSGDKYVGKTFGDSCGIYYVDDARAQYNLYLPETPMTISKSGCIIEDNSNLYSLEMYDNCENIWSLQYADDKLFCAAGAAGLIVSNSLTGDTVTLKTEGAAFDIKLIDGLVYVAEGFKGLGIYQYEGDSLTCIGRYKQNVYNAFCSRIEYIEGCNEIIIKNGWTRCCVIDISNPSKPTLKRNFPTGLMYSETICSGTVGCNNYIVSFDNKYISFWRNNNGEIELDMQLSNTVYSEYSGVAICNSGVIVTSGKGYYLINPTELTDDSLTSARFITIEGLNSSGVPYVFDNNLIITNSQKGIVCTVDISNPYNPVLVDNWKLNSTPGKICYENGHIYIALAHDGYIKCSKNMCKVSHSWEYSAQRKKLTCTVCEKETNPNDIGICGWVAESTSESKVHFNDGKIDVGVVNIDGELWGFDAKGLPYTGLMTKSGEIFYFINGLSQSGLFFLNNHYCFFDGDKKMTYGSFEVDVADSNGLLCEKTIMTFEQNLEFKNESNGIVCYTEGLKAYLGLICLDGEYYYINSKGLVVTGEYNVTKSNGLMPPGKYEFDENGKMILSVAKEGIVLENDTYFYYLNGSKTYAGLIEVDNSYYYVNSKGIVVTGSYYVTKTNGIMPAGRYAFDAIGKMIIEHEIKDGIVEEEGSLYYYKAGKKYYAGLFEEENFYYYANSKGQIVTGIHNITKTNGLKPEGKYEFDDNGRMIVYDYPDGINEIDGEKVYICNGSKYYAGLIIIDADYYYVNSKGTVVTGSYYVTKTNDLLPEGRYSFDMNGKLLFESKGSENDNEICEEENSITNRDISTDISESNDSDRQEDFTEMNQQIDYGEDTYIYSEPLRNKNSGEERGKDGQESDGQESDGQESDGQESDGCD